MNQIFRPIALAALCMLAAGTAGAQSFGVPPAPASGATPAVSVAGPGVELAPQVTLSVGALRRLTDKGVLQLEFTVANRSDLAVSLRDLGLGNFVQMEGIELVDFANKRRYAMGKSEGTCLCSSFPNGSGGVVKPAETKRFWGWFALPPAGVQQMAVTVAGRSPILDVQLQ